MPRINTKDAVQDRAQAGKVMYTGKASQDAGDDLFEEDEQSQERGYHYSGTGLDIRRELSVEAWRNILPEIKAMQTAYQLIIGDWMVYGFEQGYEQSYESMAELTGLKSQTVEVYASVCRNVPQLMRVNSLKFNHYRLVSKLPDDEKALWIQFAVHRQLPTRALEKLIDLSQSPRLPAGPGDNTTIVPYVAPEPTPLPDEDAVDLPSDLGDKSYRQRFTTVFKKVATDALTVDDLQEVALLRKWCDQVIQGFKPRTK